MFSSRLSALKRTMGVIKKSNTAFTEAKSSYNQHESRVKFLEGMQYYLKTFTLSVTENESLWRESLLKVLEYEIMKGLAVVFPTDGYTVKLESSVSRGNIHITASVSSRISEFPGRIVNTQGRLFQQIVSFMALLSIMSLLGVKTIYIDELFSGSSLENIEKLNTLLRTVGEQGYNIIMIAQNASIADGMEVNRLVLSRTESNRTIVSGG